MKKLFSISVLVLIFIIILSSEACKKDPNPNDVTTTPYNLVIPKGLPKMAIPDNNLLTVEGVALGRKLFYDPILSASKTMSCATCHMPKYAFTDSTNQFSTGIDGIMGNRNSMPIFNLGFQKNFFWDGGAIGLENQSIAPIQNEIEMHETLPNVIRKLNAHPEYPALFKKAFGGDTINTSMLMKAIAQFERTIISGNSKYDKYVRGEATLTSQELNGLAIYEDPNKGDCTHCHTLGSTFTDFEFRNNGVDSISADAGRYRITLNPADSGKFKTPSLRNIELTAPYMHDGRFKTLKECMDHYNTGFHYAKNLDPLLRVQPKGRMTNQEMEDVIAFMKTLTDVEFTTNAAYQKP